MAQEKVETLQPNLKRFSEKEKLELALKACKLLQEGKKAVADILVNQVPLHWKSAKVLKELVGIDAMIASGTNLSEAVDHYGIEWLGSGKNSVP